MAIETRDVLDATDRLRTLAEREQGYAERVSTDHESGSVMLRVPTRRLAAVRRAVHGLGTVTEEREFMQDAVDQRAEVSARLRSARAEERSLALASDDTGFEVALASARTRIEQLEAEQRGLEQRIEYAHLEVHVARTHVAYYDDPWATLAVAGSFGLKVATAVIVAFATVLAAIGPTAAFFALFAAGLASLIHLARRRRVAT